MAMIVPTVEVVGDETLTNSIIDRSITELQDNIITALPNNAMQYCKALKKVVFGTVSSVGMLAFSNCTSLEVADFYETFTLTTRLFMSCGALKALILRGSTVSALSNTNAFEKSGIANGTGYIYVPAALVDSYKTATNWSTYANQIRAIEDYPEVCSTLGKAWVASEFPRSGNFYAGCYANGLWVTGIQANGDIYYSEDGATWTGCGVTMFRTYSVEYSDGLWIAAGQGSLGDLYYSEDGKTWTPSNMNANLCRVSKKANGLWVVGCSAGLWYSEDGKTWTQSNITSGTVIAPVYADGLWVAGSIGAGLYYSEDGKTWSQSNVTDIRFATTYYANGLWVAGTDNTSYKGVYYSEDGKTWVQSNLNKYAVNSVAYSNGLWVAGTGNGIYTSSDAKSWTQVQKGSAYGVSCVNGRWLVGCFGILYSDDGVTWIKSNITSGTLQVFSYGGGRVVAFGSGCIYYSE